MKTKVIKIFIIAKILNAFKILKGSKVLQLLMLVCVITNAGLLLAATDKASSAPAPTPAPAPATSPATATNKLAASAPVAPEVSQETKNKIQAAINAVLPEVSINKVTPSPIAGFYQAIAGGEVFYISHDLRYMFYGSLLDLNLDKQQWNITENLRQLGRQEALAAVESKDMIIFSPQEVKGIVTVFTDVDCVFCQRFHKNIEEVLAKGIEVRYLAFPRAGLDSDTYKKMVSIWCADDKKALLTLASSGGTVPDRQCANNPVATQFKLGGQMGVRGTPTLVFADGYVLSSYLEPKELEEFVLEHTVKAGGT